MEAAIPAACSTGATVKLARCDVGKEAVKIGNPTAGGKPLGELPGSGLPVGCFETEVHEIRRDDRVGHGCSKSAGGEVTAGQAGQVGDVDAGAADIAGAGHG